MIAEYNREHCAGSLLLVIMVAAVQSTTEDENITKTNQFETIEKYDWTEVIQAHVKIAVVGDRGCGKTCLILSVKNRTLPDPEENFLPRHFPLDLEMPNQMEAKCMVVDVDARDEMKDVRIDVYKQSDVFLLCFAINEPNSFKNLSEKWVPEVLEFLQKKGCILVGLKSDTRKVAGNKTILPEMCEDLKELKFHKYMECSAYAQVNVLSVFQEAVKMAFKSEISEKK